MKTALATIYFNNANKSFVLCRQGNQVPPLALPFGDDLSTVLVYLDEAAAVNFSNIISIGNTPSNYSEMKVALLALRSFHIRNGGLGD